MKKIGLYEEFAYVLGLILLGFGTAFMEKSDFGLSMIVAPAYILHVKISQYLPFFSFGMSGYVLQTFLLIILCLVIRKFKLKFLMSFATAVIYGFVLDGCIMLFNFIPSDQLVLKIIYYIVGVVISDAGVAFLFKTYISPEVYDLFVKEITERFGLKLNRVKTIYDCASLLVAILLSLILFGLNVPVGVGIGTVICALVNGTLIGFFTKRYDKTFTYKRFLRVRGD